MQIVGAISLFKHFSGYFLVVRDIISRCPRTCGRGSSAASIVSYLLGISHVDPLRYDLFFERFLNPDRSDPPDIDVDFPWDERDEVFRYVFASYRGQAAMVATHVTFGPRSSIRETAKAMGVQEDEIRRMVDLWRLGRQSELPAYILRGARRIAGFPRYLGTHCGGVVITPGPILCHSHLQPSLQGFPVIAWEKDAAEDAGLVKIDLLGNRSLAVLRDTLELVEKRHGRRIAWESFSPLGHGQTRRMIEEGDTVGIFYIESPATRQLLRKMRMADFDHLIVATSIIRPAANDHIKEYVRRLRGGPYGSLHPAYDRVLKETFGIMVYQEDISRVAMAVAGMSPAVADRLRKLLSRKNRECFIGPYRRCFFKGGRRRAVPRATLQTIWDNMLTYRGYAFCKAHSASFALVSYKLAYLKLTYPQEFMASVINNEGGFYSCQTYLDEARRMGFPPLGPDVNKSLFLSAPEQSAIRLGLGRIRKLPRDFIARVLEERGHGGKFGGLLDFVDRCSPKASGMRALIRSGAMDALEPRMTRPSLYWLYSQVGTRQNLLLAPRVPAYLPAYPIHRRVLDEVRTLGVVISDHPLNVFQPNILRFLSKRKGGTNGELLVTSRDFPRYVNRRVSLAGIQVAGKEVLTRKQEQMAFVSFEDQHGIFETVFLPPVFRKFHCFLDRIGVYIIHGKIEDELGAVMLNVDRLDPVCPPE